MAVVVCWRHSGCPLLILGLLTANEVDVQKVEELLVVVDESDVEQYCNEDVEQDQEVILRS